ncbi:cell division cycle 7-related protein kinase [Galendromus occidentalis]|uniref:non-specific serine/threonine protein kinase n=1 Tax=Galendromus occidentalis TaxID=34638 RepID=A0AAJ6QXQ0_9ACAR|nr:cell division cycle 7-related protein kinase [Galendromus occidentalis]
MLKKQHHSNTSVGSFSQINLLRTMESAMPSQLYSASESNSEKDEDAIRLQQHIPQVHQFMELQGRIGEGTFSYVYKARLKSQPDRYFALKYIIPTSHPSRIMKELRYLKDIGGKDNVVELKTCFLHKGNVAIVMPFFAHDRFSDYVRLLSVNEVREYMRNLLKALARVHQFKVVHRDIKPSNFLYNRERKQYCLVDFGLAEKIENEIKCLSPAFGYSQGRKRARNDQENLESKVKRICQMQMTPGALRVSNGVTPGTMLTGGLRGPGVSTPIPSNVKLERRRSDTHLTSKRCLCFGRNEVCNVCLSRPTEVAPRAGTPGFRAPEVLMKFRNQSTAIDIWSAAVIYLSLLSGRYPFFRAHDDLSALAEVITLLGSVKVEAAAEAIGKKLTTSSRKEPMDMAALCLSLRGVDNPQRRACLDPSWLHVDRVAFDLLYKLLDPNPFTRITAEQALQHPFLREGSRMLDNSISYQ